MDSGLRGRGGSSGAVESADSRSPSLEQEEQEGQSDMLTAAKIEARKGTEERVYSAAAQDAADEDDMLLKAAEKAAWKQERKQEHM